MTILTPWRVWHLRFMQWLGIWRKLEPHIETRGEFTWGETKPTNYRSEIYMSNKSKVKKA